MSEDGVEIILKRLDKMELRFSEIEIKLADYRLESIDMHTDLTKKFSETRLTWNGRMFLALFAVTTMTSSLTIGVFSYFMK